MRCNYSSHQAWRGCSLRCCLWFGQQRHCLFCSGFLSRKQVKRATSRCGLRSGPGKWGFPLAPYKKETNVVPAKDPSARISSFFPHKVWLWEEVSTWLKCAHTLLREECSPSLPPYKASSPKYLSSKEVKMSPSQPPHLSELSGILPPTWTETWSCRPGCRLGKSEFNLSWVCSMVETEEQGFLLSLWKERIVGLSL